MEEWKQVMSGEHILEVVLGGALATLGGVVAQWFRAHVEDDRNRKTVERRLEYLLANVVTFCDLLSDHPRGKRVRLTTYEELLSNCSGFERVSDHLLFLGNPSFEMAVL